LTWASSQLRQANTAGLSACLLLRQDTKYRESINLGYGTVTAAPITVEGNGATLSGAEEFTDWTPTGSGTYTTPWPHNLGNSPEPNWGSLVYDKANLLNREALFIGDTPYFVVENLADLSPGRFHVDETLDLVTVYPRPEHAPVTSAEITVRGYVILNQGRSNVTFRNLTVERGAGGVQEVMWANQNQNNLTIENVVVRQGAGGGIGANGPSPRGSGLVYRNVSVTQMGVATLGSYKIDNVLVENVYQSGNNWRGAMATPQFLGWATGNKFMLGDNITIRDYVAVNNAHHGLWFDYENSNILVERATLAGNAGRGVFFEVSQGPAEMRDSTVCNNSFSGVTFARTENVTIRDSRIFDNRGWQFLTSGGPTPVTLSNGITVYGNGMRWINNIVSSSHDLDAKDSIGHNWLFNIGHRYGVEPGTVLAEASGNIWHHVRPDAWHLGNTAFGNWSNLAQYQAYFAPQGSTDVWAASSLTCPANMPPVNPDFQIGW
jgi:hypothetical protein